MDQQDTDNPTITEDLPVDEARQNEVKGGRTGIAGVGILRSTDGGSTW